MCFFWFFNIAIVALFSQNEVPSALFPFSDKDPEIGKQILALWQCIITNIAEAFYRPLLLRNGFRNQAVFHQICFYF